MSCSQPGEGCSGRGSSTRKSPEAEREAARSLCGCSRVGEWRVVWWVERLLGTRHAGQDQIEDHCRDSAQQQCKWTKGGDIENYFGVMG